MFYTSAYDETFPIVLIRVGFAYASRATSTYQLRSVMPKFQINDMVDITIPGLETPIVGVVEMVQGYTSDGLIYEPDHPSVVGWQYVIGGLAYDERYLQISGP